MWSSLNAVLQARAAVPRRAEDDLLVGVVDVRVPVVVGADEGVDVDEVLGLGGLSGARVGHDGSPFVARGVVGTRRRRADRRRLGSLTGTSQTVDRRGTVTSAAYGCWCHASSAGLDDDAGAARRVGVVAGRVEHDRATDPAAGQPDAVGLLGLAAEVDDARRRRGRRWPGRPCRSAATRRCCGPRRRPRATGSPSGSASSSHSARLAAVDAVEVLDEVVHPVVQRLVEQPPVEAAALRPLRLLAELAAHEDQLLAGVAPHVGEEGAQRRDLLLARAPRLAQQRALAVHDLVVADRQDEVLARTHT